jgi:hypothetical protein
MPPTINSQFGAMFVPEDLEKATRDLLHAWLPTYLHEVERQQEVEPGKIARPKFIGTSVEADLFPGEELPAIIVVAPGTAGEPERGGDGSWSAWYQVTIACLVQSPDELSTRALAGYYAAAVRGAILQHASINGKVEGTWWLGEEFEGAAGQDRNRTRGAVLVHFRCKVPNIVDSQNGPMVVPVEIPGELPTIQEIDISVDSEADEPT